ncbi:protein TRI1 isoform X1 [Ziziphus jujuba]|uniref:Protein TRI1 isoform X1 n=1 Tax=Ziziphus jujuba TaxID=326968 RepID=A0ABM3IUR2_ZIZJJ|nr:protein TRI1 isoform X1 [Ziziphus jujuba]
MVSDSELIERLREFLRNSDLNTTTTAIVRRKLQEDFGVDLSDKKAFIREQVDLFLQSELDRTEQEQEPEEEEEEEEGDNRSLNGKSEESDGYDLKKEDEEEDDGGDEYGEDAEVVEFRNTKRKKRTNKLSNEVKKRGSGFSKLCSLSPQLQEFIGVSEMARTEVVKQMWAYIREKNLQDPSNKRIILCDEPLRALFGVDSIDMFQMNKALSKHIWSLNSDGVGSDNSTPKKKQRKQDREALLQVYKHSYTNLILISNLEPDEPKSKEKRQKGGKSGFLAPLQLSGALVKFLGTGESELSRADVVKRMWDYIKQNNLQDPSDKRRILCDEKLKELFDVDSFNGFTVSKFLSAHFIKTGQ